MEISKLEDISPELRELLTKNSDEDFKEIQEKVGSTPTEKPWSYILLGGHFGHIGIIKFLIDNKVGIKFQFLKTNILYSCLLSYISQKNKL